MALTARTPVAQVSAQRLRYCLFKFNFLQRASLSISTFPRPALTTSIQHSLVPLLFPRPLQQVQANRVKRGQRCLHGALHPEQGRKQKARQKCELQLNFNNIPSSKLLSRWASRGNFRAEPWNAEIQLKASPPLLRGELSGEHKKTKKQEEGFSHQHCQMSQS